MRQSPLLSVSVAAFVLAVGLYGCESPEAFHLTGDGSLLASGTGGDDGPDTGTGGSGPGTGGLIGSGGSLGTGGMSVPTGGKAVPGTGGAGGHVSTGGTAAGGHGASASGGTAGHSTGGTVATGGTPAGGSTGSGGRATGGSIGTGSGGTSPGSGGGAGSGSGGHTAEGGATGGGGSAAGGATGTGPCAGLCAPATDFKFTSGTSYQSPNLGTTAVCYEVATTLTLQGGGCSNCSSRTAMINGTMVSSSAQWSTSTIPAKVNGGYCFQVGAGTPDYAQFFVF